MSEQSVLTSSLSELSEKEAFLDDMAVVVTSGNNGQYYPGYPLLRDRLFIAEDELQYDTTGRIILPAYPQASYTVFDHSHTPTKPRSAAAFHDTGGPLPPEEAARITWGDMDMDARGFPLHRFATDMLTDRAIGAVIGPGYFWHPGQVKTADAGIVALGQPGETGLDEHGFNPAVRAALGNYLCVLVVHRQDNEQFGLPGGRVDPGEVPVDAAARETDEETRTEVNPARLESLGARIVADPRLTTCTEITNHLFAVDMGDIPEKPPEGADETLASRWYVADLSMLAPERRQRFFGSHWRMIREVVAWYQQKYDVTVTESGLVVPN